MIETSPVDTESTEGGRTGTAGKRRLVVAGIAIAFVALAGGLGWVLLQNAHARTAAERERTARVAAHKADAVLEQVFASLAARDRLWAAPSDVEIGEVQTNVSFTQDSLKKIRTEQLPAVRKAVADCGSAEVERRYTAVADSLESILASAATGLQKGSSRVALYTQVQSAENAIDRGRKQVHEAVLDGNARKYASSSKHSSAARSEFVSAVKLYQAAMKKESSADIRTGLAVAKQCLVLADLQIELARIGPDAGASRYNEQVRKTNRQREVVAAAEVGNSRLGPGMRLWSEVQDLAGDFTYKTAAVKRSWEDAKTYVATGEIR